MDEEDPVKIRQEIDELKRRLDEKEKEEERQTKSDMEFWLRQSKIDRNELRVVYVILITIAIAIVKFFILNK